MSAPSTAQIGTRYGVPGNMWAAKHHTGVDFLCPTGSTIKSPVLSKIIHAGPNSATGWGAAYGIHVIGECKVGGVTYRWIVAHLRSVAVKAGQSVRRGMILGYSNSTGNVTGPHCHFEVRKGSFAYGTDVNPQILISITSDGASTDKMDPAAYFLGAHGDHVTWLGTRLALHLKARGLKSPYKSGPGPLFTETDRYAVTQIQLALGFRGKDADGYPGEVTLKLLAADPATTPPAAPVKTKNIREISLNCAGYDVKYGMAHDVQRVPQILSLVLEGRPDMIHLQECSAPMLSAMNAGMKAAGYVRVKAGGKGRQSYYHGGRGITIFGSKLSNVKHELDGDDKPFLMIAYSLDGGYKGVTVNFHNENEGTTVQKSQMVDVLTAGLAWADRYGISHRNVLATGDSNRKETAADQEPRNWIDIGTALPEDQSTGEQYHSTNAWKGRSEGRRIDVDLVRFDAIVVSYGQMFTIVSDHYAHATVRSLVKL